MLGNSINIKNFNWNTVVLKKFAKTSKNNHFPTYAKKRSRWATPKTKNFFF